MILGSTCLRAMTLKKKKKQTVGEPKEHPAAREEPQVSSTPSRASEDAEAGGLDLSELRLAEGLPSHLGLESFSILFNHRFFFFLLFSLGS